MELLSEPLDFGDYKLVAHVDKGGMAEVFLGLRPSAASFDLQFLAIKKLLPHLNSNKPFINLLIHEAKIGVLLNHPAIASVYDLGSYKAEFFLAMEYVHGKSLERLIQRLKEQDQLKNFPPEVAGYLALELLKALTFAHDLHDAKNRELGIVHRDVSPGNLLISYRGEVKLTDFGIATAEHRLQSGFTQVALGKLHYISPEQALNDQVSRASDLFSTGVMLYYLLSGQLPFEAKTSQDLLRKVIQSNPEPLHKIRPSVPKELSDIVMQCLKNVPKNRFASAPELYQRLYDFYLKTQKIDFSSKPIRDYYQKKLSELLKSSFSVEFAREAKIIEGAVKLLEKINAQSFKETLPQNKPAPARAIVPKLSDDEDHTVFQQDVSNESTRFLELTSEEQAAYSRMQPSFPALSVEEKLGKSSLSREEKENLKAQMPRMQINTQAELEEFETSTLTRRPKEITESLEDSEATRAMRRSEIIRNFSRVEKKQNEKAVSEEDDDEDSIETPSAVKAFLHRSFVFAWKPLLALVILAGLGMGVLPLVQKWLENRKPFVMLPLQRVELYVVIPKELESRSSEILQSLQQADALGNLSQVENLFNSEFKRYQPNAGPALRLLLNKNSKTDAVSLSDLASSLKDWGQIFEKFSSLWNWRGDAQSHAVVYMIAASSESVLAAAPITSLESAKLHYRARGLVSFDADLKDRMTIFLALAREIAWIYGAREKWDARTNRPLFPDGYASPTDKPLLPQGRAELMGKTIPVSDNQTRTPAGLQEIVIGATTARELGWTQ